MTHDGSPDCERHEQKIPMQLRTLHSDSSRPDTVVGLYECPECGHERRQPLESAPAETPAA